jgi:hypothetical protein
MLTEWKTPFGKRSGFSYSTTVFCGWVRLPPRTPANLIPPGAMAQVCGSGTYTAWTAQVAQMPRKGSAVADCPFLDWLRLWRSSRSGKGYGRSTQKPLQLSPSFVGSQLSEGSSTHNIPPWHVIIDGPPQGALNFCSAPLPATHVPGQLRPSLVGSHLSWGLSTHDIPRGH